MKPYIKFVSIGYIDEELKTQILQSVSYRGSKARPYPSSNFSTVKKLCNCPAKRAILKVLSHKMGYFENIKFMSADCHNLYYADLPRTKLFLERCIFIDRVPKKFANFFNRLATTGWICISPDLYQDNEHWGQRFLCKS
ncbi:putative protein isoform X1 [Capsicum chacoense]